MRLWLKLISTYLAVGLTFFRLVSELSSICLQMDLISNRLDLGSTFVSRP